MAGYETVSGVSRFGRPTRRRVARYTTATTAPKQPSDTRLQFLQLVEKHLSEAQIDALATRIASRHGLGPYGGPPSERLQRVLLRAVSQTDARRYRVEFERRLASGEPLVRRHFGAAQRAGIGFSQDGKA